MSQSLSVDEVADAIKKMSRSDRERLLSKIAEVDELIEDLDDIADLVRAKREPGSSFDEFVEELKAEGYDIPTRDQADSKEAA